MPDASFQTINPNDLHIESSVEFHFVSPWTAQWHAHPEHHELIIVRKGGVQTRIAQQTLQAQHHEILVYPCGLFHQPAASGPDNLRFQSIRWRSHQTPLSLQEPIHRMDRLGHVGHLSEWIQRSWPPVDAEARHLANLWLAAILTELQRLQEPRTEDWIAQLKRSIFNRLARRIQLDDLAREVGMSKFHLSRRFKAATGLSPMQFVNRLRIEQAKGELLHTDQPIEAIAEATGFCDAGHLSRRFRQIFGENPGAFRKRHAVPLAQAEKAIS